MTSRAKQTLNPKSANRTPVRSNADADIQTPSGTSSAMEIRTPFSEIYLNKSASYRHASRDNSLYVPETPDVASAHITHSGFGQKTSFFSISKTVTAANHTDATRCSTKMGGQEKCQSARRKKFVPPMKRPAETPFSTGSPTNRSQRSRLPETALSPDIAPIRLPRRPSDGLAAGLAAGTAARSTGLSAGSDDDQLAEQEAVHNILRQHSQTMSHGRESSVKVKPHDSEKENKTTKLKPVMRLDGKNMVLQRPPRTENSLTPANSSNSAGRRMDGSSEPQLNLIRRRRRQPLQQMATPPYRSRKSSQVEPQLPACDSVIQFLHPPRENTVCPLVLSPVSTSSHPPTKNTVPPLVLSPIGNQKISTSQQKSAQKRKRQQDGQISEELSSRKKLRLAIIQKATEMESCPDDEVWKFTENSSSRQASATSISLGQPVLKNQGSAATGSSNRSIVLTSLHTEYV